MFFFVKIAKATIVIGLRVQLCFQLTQHSKDEELIKSFIKFFDCGAIYKKGKRFDYKVLKFAYIVNIIIPFFLKFPIEAIKFKDFEDFCRVTELMKNKAHLTQEGLEEIKKKLK